MKLWLLRGTDDFCNGWDCAQGFVIRAQTEAEARRLAALAGGDEQYGVDEHNEEPTGGWLLPENASCTELTAEDLAAGVILRDFNAG